MLLFTASSFLHSFFYESLSVVSIFFIFWLSNHLVCFFYYYYFYYYLTTKNLCTLDHRLLTLIFSTKSHSSVEFFKSNSYILFYFIFFASSQLIIMKWKKSTIICLVPRAFNPINFLPVFYFHDVGCVCVFIITFKSFFRQYLYFPPFIHLPRITHTSFITLPIQ